MTQFYTKVNTNIPLSIYFTLNSIATKFRMQEKRIVNLVEGPFCGERPGCNPEIVDVALLSGDR
jgi:hypothetical protein